jgi:ABC-2 type transport system ATP-binding protein
MAADPTAAPRGATAPSKQPPVIEARDLLKRYGRREALRGISLEASTGELVAVIGPNGAGKTTLLSILAGIQRADAGSVSLAASEIGWVPQRAAVYGKLTVAENLRLFARLHKVADPHAAVERMLALTDLHERAGDQVAELSGGNRQRVNIALGLLGEQPVLLLDEPSAALDPRQRERVWQFILGLASAGTTVIYSTHNVQEAEQYAHKVLVLADGELLFTGTPERLEEAVEREYGGGEGPAEAVPRGDFERAFVAFLRARAH